MGNSERDHHRGRTLRQGMSGVSLTAGWLPHRNIVPGEPRSIRTDYLVRGGAVYEVSLDLRLLVQPGAAAFHFAAGAAPL